VCERVPVDPGEKPAMLSKKIEDLEEVLRSQTEKIPSYESVKPKLKKARKDLKEHENCILFSQEFETKMTECSQKRREFWRTCIKKISKRASIYFNVYLSQKGYSGKLLFDHESQKLNIEVQVDSRKESIIQDTKSLSGGERSFSTVALLISLWYQMDTPFLSMDEFDVFMDSVNRKISINLLIEFAKQSSNRQFLFITPQSTDQISIDQNFMKIFKMKEPTRGLSQQIGQ